MIRTKICYLLLLVVLTAFSILYIDSYALVLLLAALILPVFLLGSLLIIRQTTTAQLHCDASACAIGESVPVTLTVHNQSCLPFARVHAAIHIQHSLSETTEHMQLCFPLHAKNTTRLVFYVHADYCGSVQITLHRVHVLDYFRLFRTKIKSIAAPMELLIMPPSLDLRVDAASLPVADADSEEHDARPGDDPSLLLGVHPYAEGDPVSRIHWKLSSRSDQLLVKEYGTPVQNRVLLLVEYVPTGKKTPAAIMQQAQALLTILYSVLQQMQAMSITPLVVWYDADAGDFVQAQPHNAKQLTDLFRQLYATLSHMPLPSDLLLDKLAGVPHSSVTYLTNHLSPSLLQAVDMGLDAMQRTLLLVTDAPVPDVSVTYTELLAVRPAHIAEDLPCLLI